MKRMRAFPCLLFIGALLVLASPSRAQVGGLSGFDSIRASSIEPQRADG